MNIRLYGAGERLRLAKEMLENGRNKELEGTEKASENISSKGQLLSKGSEEDKYEKSIVLLPVPSVGKDGRIKGTELSPNELIGKLGRGDRVIGYALPTDFRTDAARVGAYTFDLMEDEEYLCENGSLTAMGTLSYVLATENDVPSGIRIGIIGYGRIGRELTRLFIAVRGQIKVYTGKEKSLLDLCSLGIDTVRIDGGEIDVSGIDILINTAPVNMEGRLNGAKKGLRIIELASGNNFGDTEGVEPLPSLPERAFPLAAAKCYLKSYERQRRAKGL